MDIKNEAKKAEQTIIENLTTLISYPSILNANEGGYPFGEENAACLDTALAICNSYGFKTKNLDNYCGYAEIGEGEEIIGIVAHLDVVPVTEGWDSDPFTATIRDGKLYGRGASDDKGPVCCAMEALRIVKELQPKINKRIRLILGCNEESGSLCLAHYVEKEGHLTYGFTPDGSFPGVYGEKGMVMGHFECPTNKILSINAGLASNVVPNVANLILEKGSYNKDKLASFFKIHQIKYEEKDINETTALTVYGTSAHASTPDYGVNPISYAICGLQAADMQDPFVDFYVTRFGLSVHGENMHIDFKDDYGDLSLNIGVIKEDNHIITGTIDIRFPVTLTAKKITDGIQMALKNRMIGNIIIDHTAEPLFFSPDSPLMSTLYQSYVEVTNDTENKPITMGGGTYAKGINNCVAFGGEFPSQENVHMHDANEFIEVEHLSLQTEIYVHAILNLLKL